MSSQEPPTYSQLPDTQLLIVPSSNSIQFQNGFLGVDDTNSVEGEVHVKGALPGDWSRLSVRISRMTNKLLTNCTEK
jgi:neural Wiskott-Aldrich syndrome protein